jgi:Ca2+-binding EF-hand superfamily protein
VTATMSRKQAWARPASPVRAAGVQPTPPQLPVPTWAGRLRQQREADVRRGKAAQRSHASWQVIRDAFDVVAGTGARAVDEVGLASLLGVLEIPIRAEQVPVVIRQMRARPDGRVGIDSFATWYIRTEKQRKLEELERIREAFDIADRDGSGALDKREVAVLSKRLGTRLKSLYSSKNLNTAWAEMDPNGDGRVVFEEFRDWWIKRQEIQKAERDQALAEKVAQLAAQHVADSKTEDTQQKQQQQRGRGARCTSLKGMWGRFSLTTCVSERVRLCPAGYGPTHRVLDRLGVGMGHAETLGSVFHRPKADETRQAWVKRCYWDGVC